MFLPAAQIAAIGVNKDLPAQRLPLHAWTDVLNASFRDGYVGAVREFAPLFYDLASARWILALPSENGVIGLQASNVAVHGFTETTQADVTRISGAYTGGDFDFWQGELFQGFVIANNGVDVPQVWNPLTLATPLIDMSTWPASTTAKVVRGFKNFLVALDVTKSAVRDRRLVKWSHSADPNTLPSSWDETDASLDTGEQSLAEGSDGLIDQLVLGDANILYSETQSWLMQFVGGQSIFSFRNLFPLSGILAQGCVVKFGAAHFVVTQDDIIVHNGSTLNSVADASVRNWFFTNLSPNFYTMTRVVRMAAEREIWICFSTYNDTLNRALIWNWRFNTWTIRELPYVRSICSAIRTPSLITDNWETNDYTWAGEIAQTWGDTATYKRNEAVYSISDGGVSVYGDSTGADYAAITLEKTDIVWVGQEEADEYNFKEIIAIRPSFEGIFVPVTISVGFRNDLWGAVTWSETATFTTLQDVEIQVNVTGKYLAVKFEWATTSQHVKFYGYGIDIVLLKEGL